MFFQGEVIDGLQLNIVALRNISKEEDVIIGYDVLQSNICTDGDDQCLEDERNDDYDLVVSEL